MTLATAMPFGALAMGPDQPAQVVDKLVDVGGHNLNFRIISGKGATILLESGGGMTSTEWDSLAPRLARETGATVIAYDRAGFGKSDLLETKADDGEAAVRRIPAGNAHQGAARPARTVGAPGSNLAEKVAVMRKAVVPKGIPVRVITSGTTWLPKPEDRQGPISALPVPARARSSGSTRNAGCVSRR